MRSLVAVAILAAPASIPAPAGAQGALPAHDQPAPPPPPAATSPAPPVGALAPTYLVVPASPVLRDGSRYAATQVELEAMQGVRFAATSHVPLGLRVLAPTGEAWAVAEPGQTTTATVDLVAPYSGSYRVLMVVPPGTDTASIAFSMTPLDPPAAVALSTPSTPMVVELGQTVTGRYDVPPAPGAAQPWTLVLRERALVGAFLRGTGYDPRMHLLDAAGNVLEASDDALEADAYVQLVLEPGLYTVAAEQAGSGVGTYTLDVFGGPRTRLEVPTLTPTSPLQLALIEGLPRNHTGRRVAPFAVEVPAGSDVVVRLSGFLVDPLVFVYDPAGNWVAMNDDAPDGTLNSEILLSGSRPGVYVLHAATYNNALGTLTATAVLTPSVTAP